MRFFYVALFCEVFFFANIALAKSMCGCCCGGLWVINDAWSQLRHLPNINYFFYGLYNNKVELKSIASLSGLRFVVPGYQRRYRWGESEVKRMLKDFQDFCKSEREADDFYCLQPVVVLKHEKDGGQYYELIDGQQRLTTLYIILRQIDKSFKLYSLDYATRPGSTGFLEELGARPADAVKNIDYYHMQRVHDAVEEWFGDNNDDVQQIAKLISDGRVKIIWYEVGWSATQSNIDVFARLNIGKIPLTDSELLKVLFLRGGNFEQGEISLRQVSMASQWNAVEHRLRDENFWAFINGAGEREYSNRIDFIFDSIVGRPPKSEPYYTFFKFELEMFNCRKAEDVWRNDVFNYFQTLDEWYNDRELYHLIGFLLNCRGGKKASIGELVDMCRKSKKDEFLSEVKSRIREVLGHCQLSDLRHDRGSDKSMILNVLLLLNIVTLQRRKESNARFSFGDYKAGSWDVEHVRPKEDLKLSGENLKKWIDDVLEYFKQEPGSVADDAENGLIPRLEMLRDNGYKAVGDGDDLLEEVRVRIEGDDVDEVDGLGNLTLLDSRTNRSYKNALFYMKRKRIIENDKGGVFVPIATKNLFMKFYTPEAKGLWRWTQDDADNYVKEIAKVLNEYLPA